MKTVILIAAILLVTAVNAQAAAKIITKDFDGKRHAIALDSKGVPRIDGKAKTYPTIKDFRKDGDAAFFCIDGSDRDIRQLLTGLVTAADGDGDSYADLKAIYENPRSWAVLADITDESGKNVERFSFPNCK